MLTGARNGYFFVIDRLTGEHLLTSKLVDSPNWAQSGFDKEGAPQRVPAKDFDFWRGFGFSVEWRHRELALLRLTARRQACFTST